MQDYGRKNSEHISIGNWMLTLFFTLIPGIGLIGLVFCLCSRKRSKRNYALAIIVWILVIAAIVVIGYFVLKQFSPDTLDKILQPVRDLLNGWGVKLPF